MHASARLCTRCTPLQPPHPSHPVHPPHPPYPLHPPHKLDRRCWRAGAAAARRRRRRRRTRSSPRARRPGGATRAGREEPRGCDSVSTRLSCLIGLRKATASIGFTRCGKHQRPEIVGVALSALCGLTLSARCGVRSRVRGVRTCMRCRAAPEVPAPRGARGGLVNPVNTEI